MKKCCFLSILLLIFSLSYGQRDFTAPHIVKNGTVITKGQAIDNTKSGIYESFEIAVPPTGWTKANPDGGSGWAKIADGTSPLPGWNGGTMTVPAGGGNNAAYCTWNTGGSSRNDQWLITPAVTIETGNELKFWMYHYSSTYKDNLEVLLSTTDANTSSFTTNIHTFTDLQDSPWTEYTYDLSAYVGQTVYFAFRDVVADNYNDGGFLAIDLVQIGSREAIDLVLQDVTTPNYSQHANINITGDIINNGADAISSFDLTYNINGGTESAVYHATGLNIASDASYSFTHDVPYNFDTDGIYTINITISNVNGGGENNLDDNSKSKQITIYSNSVQRKVLLENFTTGQCPNCPPIHTLLENYVAAHPDAILLAQHAGYYTDEMTIPENTELLAMYNAGGGTYAPGLAIDRFHYATGLTGGSADPGPVFWPGESTSSTTSRIDDRLLVPSFVSLNINGTNNSGVLDLTVSGELVSAVSGSDLRLVVYLSEDGLQYSQSGTSGTYTHNNVMRDAVSGTWGDAGVITANTAGTQFSQNYSYTLDGSWDPTKMSIIAFVANYTDGDVNDREVLNAEKVKISDLQPLSVSNINSVIKIYPNPVNNTLNISHVKDANVKVYDLLGKLVLSKDDFNSNIDVSSLDEGTYFVKIYLNNTIVNKKVVISR